MLEGVLGEQGPVQCMALGDGERLSGLPEMWGSREESCGLGCRIRGWRIGEDWGMVSCFALCGPQRGCERGVQWSARLIGLPVREVFADPRRAAAVAAVRAAALSLGTPGGRVLVCGAPVSGLGDGLRTGSASDSDELARLESVHGGIPANKLERLPSDIHGHIRTQLPPERSFSSTSSRAVAPIPKRVCARIETMCTDV
jgi:hypothetical protein